MLKVKVVLEQIMEFDVDSIDELNMSLPADMEEVGYFEEESRSIATTLLSSSLVD